MTYCRKYETIICDKTINLPPNFIILALLHICPSLYIFIGVFSYCFKVSCRPQFASPQRLQDMYFKGSACIVTITWFDEFCERCILQVPWQFSTLSSWKWLLVLLHGIGLWSPKGKCCSNLLNHRLALCVSEPHTITSYNVSYSVKIFLFLWRKFVRFIHAILIRSGILFIHEWCSITWMHLSNGHLCYF